MRLLGIDYGTKRIGIALSDEQGDFAFPHSIIQNCLNLKCAREVVSQIGKICKAEMVKKIILGESVDYKGRPNPVMKKIEEFKILLEKEIGLPVFYQSEVMTTAEALRPPERLAPRGLLSRKRSGHAIKKNDASSATIILKSFIERGKVVE